MTDILGKMDILHKINWVDILIVIVMLRTCYISFTRGLSHEIFPLIGSVVMLTFGLRYYITVSEFVYRSVVKAPMAMLDLLSFVAIILSTGFFCMVIGGFLDHIIKVTWHPILEKFGGLLIGTLKACVVTCLVLSVIMLIPLSYLQRAVRDKSLMGMRFIRAGITVSQKVSGPLPVLPFEKVTLGKDDILGRLSRDKSIFPATQQDEGLKIPQ